VGWLSCSIQLLGLHSTVPQCAHVQLRLHNRSAQLGLPAVLCCAVLRALLLPLLLLTDCCCWRREVFTAVLQQLFDCGPALPDSLPGPPHNTPKNHMQGGGAQRHTMEAIE